MERRRAGAYVALVLVQVFFATMAVAGKLALRELPPLVLSAVRATFGALALVAVSLVLARGRLPSGADLATFAKLGVFGVFLNQILFIYGLSLTSAVNAVLLVSTIPAFTYLFAVLARAERPDALHLVGLALSFVGVGVIVGAGGFRREDLLGDALVILNAASYGWYLVISRPVVERHPPATVVAWAFAFGALGIAAVASPGLAALDWGAVGGGTWRVVLFIVAVPTIGAYSLNLVALRSLPSRTVAAFAYLQPVVGAVLAVLLLGETLRPATAAGAALVLAGIGLVLRKRRDSAIPA